MATLASRIFPPKALPRMMSCTRGKTIEASINAGERKNLRISRSTMAIIRFIRQPRAPAVNKEARQVRLLGPPSQLQFVDVFDSWLQAGALRHHEGIGFL